MRNADTPAVHQDPGEQPPGRKLAARRRLGESPCLYTVDPDTGQVRPTHLERATTAREAGYEIDYRPAEVVERDGTELDLGQ